MGERGVVRPPLPGGPYLVLGLARSGLAAASALRRRGETVIGVDAGAPKVAERLRAEGVETHLESDGLQLLGRVRTVVKSPGVPEDAPAVVGASAQGLNVIGELELGWRLTPNRTIAVTGTNGKTTTVELIAHIHREAQLPVAAAGNVGLALSALADRLDGQVTVVCEASSFQLQDTTAFAPDVAVLLNLAPDHLDRHADFDEYVEAKLRAFARQGQDALAVLPADPGGAGVDPAGGRISAASIEARIERLGGRGRVVRFGEGETAEVGLRDGAIWWREQRLIDPAKLRIVGSHNARNAMAAAAVCLEQGLPLEAVSAGLRSFAGVRHRLEPVGRRGGVAYVNDSKATNLASTVVALTAVAGEGAGGLPGSGLAGSPPAGFGGRPGRRRVHLIAGGQGKGQDFSGLRAPVAATCAGVYLIGEDATAIAAALEGLDVPVEQCGDLASALERASAAARLELASARWVAAARRGRHAADAEREAESAERGAESEQIVLLAPGCASFDQFANFEDRGDRFKEMVSEL